MDDVHLHRARSWLHEGERVAVATIVHIEGSSNQPLGSRMYVASGRAFTGSVSGGCVEGDIAATAERVCASGTPELLHYGPVEDPVFEVGLNCDGEIWVLLEAADGELLSLLTRRETGVLVTRFDSERAAVQRARLSDSDSAREPGSEMDPETAELIRHARRSGYAHSARREGGDVLLAEPILPPPELLIFGATEVAASLARIAREVGFHVLVTDPRSGYASAESHPDAHEIIVGWPREVLEQHEVGDNCYIVSLNHEPRFEDALIGLLAEKRVRPAYIGAIGKRSRHHDRMQRAKESGIDIAKLPTIHTPIGLDIGGKRPAEVALSIAAELLAVRYGRSGGSHLSRYRQLGATEVALESSEPSF